MPFGCGQTPAPVGAAEGKVVGRSYAFNDDGYRNMEVAEQWRKFASAFLPERSPYEINDPPS